MKLRILGAAGEVTGSNYMIETAGYKVLVDCGTHQGADEERHEGESFPYDPTGIDAVLLTHAHIDHSGRIPLKDSSTNYLYWICKKHSFLFDSSIAHQTRKLHLREILIRRYLFFTLLRAHTVLETFSIALFISLGKGSFRCDLVFTRA